MKIKYSRQFYKDVSKLPYHTQRSIAIVVVEMENANKLFDVKNCIKMQGYKDLYRIRVGEYRIILLLYICGNTVEFKRVLPRGQSYKKHIN